MKRKPSDDDLIIDIEGVGTFRYAQRTMGDTIKMRRRFLELAGGAETGDMALEILSDMTALHETLLVECPEGFDDLSNIKANMLVGGIPAQKMVFRLYSAFTAKEAEFRQEPRTEGEGPGAGAQ